MTDLERAIAHAIAGVQWGERVTYGELAARAGARERRAPRARSARRAASSASCSLPPGRASRRPLGEYGAQGCRSSSGCSRSRARREPTRQMRIVCLGGGTGLSTLLRGLKTVGRGAHRHRHPDRRRRLVRASAARPRHAAARRHPRLPGRAGRGRVVHGRSSSTASRAASSPATPSATCSWRR